MEKLGTVWNGMEVWKNWDGEDISGEDSVQ